jgi:putative membrane protein
MDESDKRPAGPSDHLANERTFLAWIRTCIALMGFGFVVVKFALFIKQLSIVMTDKKVALPAKGYSSEIGTLLVATGVLMALYAYARYLITEKQLINNNYRPAALPAVLLTLSIIIIGTLLIFYLVPNL